MRKLPVRWTSFVYDASGYADETRNMVLHLDQEKLQIKLIPAGHRSDTFGILEEDTRQKLDRMVQEKDHPNPVNIVWLPAFYLTRNSEAVANIVRTMFETDRIPAEWVKPCNHMDEIWVPSQFNVETFTQMGVSPEKLFVIHSGVDPDMYFPEVVPTNWENKKGYNFLSVFEWHHRKGWDVLLDAYLTGFSKKDDVALVLKVNLSFTTIEKVQRQMYEHITSRGFKIDNIPDIVLINQYYTSKEMAALYAACDAFVLPSRGEGWGRPYMEAMAVGLPTIGTCWSGQTEFMNDDNSYLISIDGLEHVSRGHVLPGHQWARPSFEHTMALMRQVYENRAQACEKGSRARKEIVESWSWKNAAEKVEQRLNQFL